MSENTQRPLPITIYDKDVNNGIPIEMNLISFPYTVNVKIGLNEVNEKSSSLDENQLFPQNTWRGFHSGQISITGIIDRTVSVNNIITRALCDSLLKSPNSKLIVSSANGAKFYDIESVTYNVSKIGEENIGSDVTTSISSLTSSSSSTLKVNSVTGLVVGYVVKAYTSGDTGNFELLEISSISGTTLTFKTKTIMSHSAGATLKYIALDSCPKYTYTMKLIRCRNPSTY